MRRDGIMRVDNASGIIAAGVFVLMLLCVPLAMRVDERIDRNRPMYQDLSRMEALQTQSVAATGRAVPLQLSGGGSAEVNGTEFVASEGVTLTVRALDDGSAYCVSVGNQHGAEAEHCS